ncbi:MAG: carbohydrate ABC transporter permease [Ktedonobacteraceae bacterium]
MAQLVRERASLSSPAGLIAARKRRNTVREITTRTIIYVTALVVLVLQFFPLLWALLTSLMTPQETTSVPATLLPMHPTFVSYVEALRGNIGHYYINSTIVSVVSTIITMLLATLAAYAFARLHFRFKTALLLFVLFFSLFPPLVQVIPIYQVLLTLHLLNTWGGLILPYSIFGLPLAVLVLIAFFQDIPPELEEAGIVDGLSRFQTFLRIVLPLTIPGLLATTIIVFVGDWNEYLFALNYTSSNTYTLPVGIVNISQTEFTTNFGVLSAATILFMVPLVVLIVLLGRRIVSGLTAGALKG